MSEKCSHCGAEVKEDAKFCASCGNAIEPKPAQSADSLEEVSAAVASIAQAAGEETAQEAATEVVEEAAPAEAAEAPVSAQETPPAAAQAEAAQGTYAAAQAQAKKKLPKWLIPSAIGLIAIVAIIVAIFNFGGAGGGSKAENTVESFLAAMEAGDFAALSKVAEVASSDIVFTAESAAPMFKLYQESGRFRKSVEWALEEDLTRIADGKEPNTRNLVDLVKKGSGYRVVIEGCSAEVYSDFACTVELAEGVSITFKPMSASDDGYDTYTPDFQKLASNGEAQKVRDLLPGAYEMKASVTSASGEVFEGSGMLNIKDIKSSVGQLSFDFEMMTIYNESDIDADIFVDGKNVATLSAYATLNVAPIQSDTMVRAVAKVDGSEEIAQEYSVEKDGWWIYLSFELAELNVWNYYDIPMYAYQGSNLLRTFEPDEDAVMTGLAPHTELTFSLYEEDIVEPITHTCEEGYDYIYPEFYLSMQSETLVRTAISDYVGEVFEAYASLNREALEALAPTQLQVDMLDLLQELEDNGAEPYADVLTVNGDIEIDYVEFGLNENDAPQIQFSCWVPYDYSFTYFADGEIVDTDSGSTEMYYELTMDYVDGAWAVVG